MFCVEPLWEWFTVAQSVDAEMQISEKLRTLGHSALSNIAPIFFLHSISSNIAPAVAFLRLLIGLSTRRCCFGGLTS